MLYILRAVKYSKYVCNCILTLYTAAPQPTLHNATVSALYGSDVTLPCTIDVANPSPSYIWESMSAEGASSEINKTLSDGSLLLKKIQKSDMYRCTALNNYGASIQMVKISKFECFSLLYEEFVCIHNTSI